MSTIRETIGTAISPAMLLKSASGLKTMCGIQIGQNGYANPDGTTVNLEQADGRVVEYVLPPAAVTVLRGVVRQCLVEPRHFYVCGYLMGSTMRLSGSGLLRYSQAIAELSTKALTSSAGYGCCMSDR